MTKSTHKRASSVKGQARQRNIIDKAKAPPKMRRYELEKYVQATLLDILRNARSEHARVNAAKELMADIQDQKDRNRQLKKDRQSNGLADEDAQRLEVERAAAEAETRELLEAFADAKRDGLAFAQKLGRSSKTEPDSAQR